MEFTEMITLQKEMHRMMYSQLKEQREFLERPEYKEKQHESTLKLPKLDMFAFSGDKLKWNEFLDSFESVLHKSKKFSNIEKFNYLKGKLIGEALNANSGLPLLMKIMMSLLLS